MIEVVDWIKENFGDDVIIKTPQFERAEELDFDYIPENEEHFRSILENAPWEVLHGMGFRKWATMNNLIDENLRKPKSETVEIPIVNAAASLSVDVGKRNDVPTKPLDEDMEIVLIPGEWFDAIPESFVVTGLHGESYPFYKDDADDDIRFGCLAYGFQRPVESPQPRG